MRKNFLLLFLMALLPLSGWAADFTTEASVTVNDIYFGLELTAQYEVNLQVNTTKITDITLDATSSKVNYYTTEACTTKATLAPGSLTPVPGTYYVKVLPSTSANSGWAAGKVIVKAMPLTVTVADASKTFNNKGTEDPDETLGAITAISQLKWKTDHSDLEADNLSGENLTAMAALMTVTRQSGKAVRSSNYTYTAAFTATNSNYTIASTSGKFSITTATFPSTRGTTGNTYSVTVTNNEKTYNGANQNATLTIVDNNLGYTLASSDYTIKYDDATTAKNYKDGGYTIKFTTKGNYGDATITLNTADDKKLVINKQPLDVYVDDLTKVYDGTVTITGATFSYSGLVGDDITMEKPFGDYFAIDATDLPTSVLTVGTYNLKAKVSGSPSGNWANYSPTYSEIGQLTVTARPVTITVADKSKEFGGTDPAFTFEVTGVPSPDDGTGATTTTAISALYSGSTTDKDLLEGLYTAKRTNTTEEVGAHADAIDVELKAVADQTDAEKKVLEQYAITVKKGKFTIGTAKLTVTPKKVTKTYGESYSLADFEVIATNAAGTRVTLTTTPTVKFKEAKYNTTNPTDAGIYIMVVDGTIAADGYDGETATRNEGQFIINKKSITAVLDDQTLMVGDGADDLLTAKVSFVEDPAAATPVNGVVEGDVIGFRLLFNEGTGTGQIANTNFTSGKTQSDADTANKPLTDALDWSEWTVGNNFTSAQATAFNAAITTVTVTASTAITNAHIAAAKAYNETLEGASHAELAAAAVNTYAAGVMIEEVASADNANYNITWTNTGKLTVVASDALALLSNDDDLANVTKLDTKTVVKSSVSIDLSARNAQKLPNTADANRIWDAKQWNTLVLPFDITVGELSTAFGYAIVNVVDATKTTENNVQFQLEMDEIPANTPFLIKTAKKLIDINADGVIAFSGTGNYTIKAPTAAQIAGADAGLGYKFVPVYETIEVDKTMSSLRFLLGNSEKWAYISETSANTWNLVPFSAYVDLSASAAPELVTFTMEEIDGSVTTVKAIESGLAKGGAAYAAEGWYTLNGVKLNGAPAQKGVYINNGKKVVIK